MDRWKSRSAKSQTRERRKKVRERQKAEDTSDQKLHSVVARSTFVVKKCQKGKNSQFTSTSGAFFEVQVSKNRGFDPAAPVLCTGRRWERTRRCLPPGYGMGVQRCPIRRWKDRFTGILPLKKGNQWNIKRWLNWDLMGYLRPTIIIWDHLGVSENRTPKIETVDHVSIVFPWKLPFEGRKMPGFLWIPTATIRLTRQDQGYEGWIRRGLRGYKWNDDPNWPS